MDTSSVRLDPVVSLLLDLSPADMEALPGLAGERARAMYREIQEQLADPDLPNSQFVVARATYCLLAIRAADQQPKGQKPCSTSPSPILMTSAKPSPLSWLWPFAG